MIFKFAKTKTLISTRITGIGQYTVDNIDPSKCTHLMYAFAILNPTSYTIEGICLQYCIVYIICRTIF